MRNRLHDRRNSKAILRECCLEYVSGGAKGACAIWMDAASGEVNLMQVRDMLKGGVGEQWLDANTSSLKTMHQWMGSIWG